MKRDKTMAHREAKSVREAQQLLEEMHSTMSVEEQKSMFGGRHVHAAASQEDM